MNGEGGDAGRAGGGLRIAALTVSDACAAGEREDLSGRRIVAWCEARGHSLRERGVVPDETGPIAARIVEWADSGQLDAILTAGGTGFGPRDVTPEATRAVLDREAPGVAEELRRRGLESTRFSVLSRGLAGSRARTFVVNLPGSPAAVSDGLAVLDDLLPHVCRLLRGEPVEHPPEPEPR